MTNFERIKNMSIEKMADAMEGAIDGNHIGCDFCVFTPHSEECDFKPCVEGIIKWLNIDWLNQEMEK